MLQSGSFKDFLACYKSQKGAASENKVMLKIEQRIPYIMREEQRNPVSSYINEK